MTPGLSRCYTFFIMRYFRHQITGAVFLFLLFVQTAPVEAKSGVAEFLNDRGKKMYRQGLVEEAVREFSKALLVDPDNKTAREYLQKLGLLEEADPPPQKTVSNIADLTRRIAILEEELAYFENRPQQDIRQQEKALKDLDVDREVLMTQLSKGKEQVASLNQKLEKDAAAHDQQIRGLQMHVDLLKEYLERDRKELVRLRALSQSYEDSRENSEELEKAGKKIAGLTGELRRMRDELKMKADESREQTARLEKESAQKTNYEQQFAELRKKIEAREEALARLKQDLNAKENKIAQYEDQIREFSGNDDLRRRRLADYEEALGAKEERIAALQKDIEKREESASLKDQLAFLKAEYESSIELLKEKEMMIRSLAEQLAELKDRQVPTAVQANVRNQLEDAKVRLLELQTALEEKDDDIAFLEERLIETEQRLELVQIIIRQKDERILSLEKQLQDRAQP